MPNIQLLEKTLPAAPLRIAALESCLPLAQKVDDYIVTFRKSALESMQSSALYANYKKDSYLLKTSCPRFGSGEAKGMIHESVRGADLFVMVDVCNYSLTYSVNGHLNHMSPDDHYQDLKRIISAATGKAHRINVIMPFLYESRQHKRTKRESLDCALGLEELIDMGVSNIHESIVPCRIRLKSRQGSPDDHQPGRRRDAQSCLFLKRARRRHGYVL